MNTIMTSLSKQDKTLVGSGQKVTLQSFLTNFCHNKVLPGIGGGRGRGGGVKTVVFYLYSLAK